MSNSTHVYGTAKALTSNAYSLTGYTFNGWNTSTNGTGTNYANGYTIPANTGLTTTANATVNLYAKWKANTYTIVYNANGGSGSMSNSTHTYDQSKTLTKNAFTKSGYIFIGWATSSTGNVAYVDEASVLNLLTSGTITLYAVWVKEGTVRIFVDGQYKMAQVYVFDNGSWHLSQPYISDSNEWKLNGG